MSVANIFNPGTTIIGKDYLPNPYPWGGGGGGGGTPTLETVLTAGNDANNQVIANASEIQADTVRCDLIEPGIDALSKVVAIDAELYVGEGVVAGEGVIRFDACNGTVRAGPGSDMTLQAGDAVSVQGASVSLQGTTLETSSRLQQTGEGPYALESETIPVVPAEVVNTLKYWEVIQTGTPSFVLAMAYSPELNRFVGVGINTSFCYSTNGVDWTVVDVSALSTNAFVSVAWSPELSLFVAVSGNANTGLPIILVSSDGITWSLPTSVPPEADSRAYQSVAWSSEIGLFAMVARTTSPGADPDLGTILTSPDGLIWTNQTAPAKYWMKIVAGNGLFVAVGETDGSNPGDGIMTSPDGIVWTERNAGNLDLWYDDITYSPQLKMFVAPGYNAFTFGDEYAYSYDGITWSTNTVPNTLSFASWLPYYGVFLSGTYTPFLEVSFDGINWLPITPVGYGGNFNNTIISNTSGTVVSPYLGIVNINQAQLVSASPVVIGSTNSNTYLQLNSVGAGGTLSLKGGSGLITVGPAGGISQFLALTINGTPYKIQLQPYP